MLTTLLNFICLSLAQTSDFSHILPPDLVWWFLPLIFLGGFLGGGLIGWIIDELTPVDARTLGVIGMQGAGKTQFYCSLMERQYTASDAGTSKTNIESFSFDWNGHTFYISRGEDIGGTKDFIKDNYERWINEKDAIVIIFDAKRYLDDKEYEKETGDRLDFIWDCLNKRYDSSLVNKHYILMGSHADQLSLKAEMAPKEIQHRTSSKGYRALFLNNFAILDLRDKDAVRKAMSKILQ